LLTPAQIIPFLTHPDPWVSNHALDYLTDAHDPSPATTDDLWHAMDALPVENRRPFYSKFSSLPQTHYSTRRLLDELPETRDVTLRMHLRSAIRQLEFPLLQSHIDEIRRLPGLPEIEIRHAEARLTLATQPPEQLWDALKSYSEEKAEASLDEMDTNVPERLIDTLSRHPDFAAPRVIEVISQSPDGSWLQVWSADLAGQLKLEATIDALLKHLDIDEEADYFAESVANALSRLGSPVVVDRLGDLIRRSDWGVRISAVDILGKIKLPESENLLPALITRELKKEADAIVLAYLGHSLAMLCPTDPARLEYIRSLILEEQYDRGSIDLVRDIVSVATMVDWRPPELESWRQATARDEKRTRELFDDPEAMQKFLDRLAEAKSLSKRPAEIPQPPQFVPLRRESPKVGRNDPCPCGSGKKYKKCCGRD